MVVDVQQSVRAISGIGPTIFRGPLGLTCWRSPKTDPPRRYPKPHGSWRERATVIRGNKEAVHHQAIYRITNIFAKLAIWRTCSTLPAAPCNSIVLPAVSAR